MRGHARSESATGVPSRVGPDKMRHPLTHDTSLYSVLPHKRRTSGGDLPASAPSPPPPVSPPSAAAPLSSSSPPQSRAKRCAAHVLLESKNQQLKANIQRLRGARLTGPDPRFVDASFDEYAGLQKSCRELARALAYSSNPGWDSAATIPQAVDACDNITATSSSSSSCYNTSARETVEKLERLRIGDHANADADGEVDELEASLGGLRILDPVDGHSRQVNEAWLTTIREWRDFVQDLLSAHQTSVLNTFRAYRRNATPETTARFLQDASFRTEAISKMKDTTPWASAKGFRKTPTFWPRYERRCHRLDTLRNVLRDAGQSLQWAEGEFHNGDDEAHHGGAADRPVREYVVAPRGDAILEFANTGAPQDACHLSPPVLRFRVSSYMLAETSPYFARLFSRDRTGDFEPFFYPPNSPPNHPQSSARNETTSYQPPPPAPPPLPSFRTVVLPGGSEARLYSMPELERNQHDALAILLHAAHMQTDKVPRAVIFAQFVAIAEVCLRYECTSPLEVFVEHFWLPAWVHMAAAAALPGNNGRAPAQGDQQPSNEHRGDQDGLLLVSYVFGLRRLFTRMSKTAILNVVDKEELWARPWPRKLKERVWAVRNAKLAQVHNACASAVQEYFQPPSSQPNNSNNVQILSSQTGAPTTRTTSFFSQAGSSFRATRSSFTTTSNTTITTTGRHTTILSPPSDQPRRQNYLPLLSLSSTPRCPKGSHACDATNLGWLLLVFNELHLLGSVMNPSSSSSGFLLSQQPQPNNNNNTDQTPPPPQPPRRSLAQLLDTLRSFSPSPPNPGVHGSDAASPGGGVCDPATALRATINDIYNSLSGLTLFEVDGKRHGWALSKGKAVEPQSQLTVSLGVLEIADTQTRSSGGYKARTMSAPAITDSFDEVMEEPDPVPQQQEEEVVDDDSRAPSPLFHTIDIAIEHPHRHPLASPPHRPFTFKPDEAVCLRILSFLDSPDDLYAAALTSRAFYAALKNNELALMRQVVREHRRLTMQILSGTAPSSAVSAVEKGVEEWLGLPLSIRPPSSQLATSSSPSDVSTDPGTLDVEYAHGSDHVNEAQDIFPLSPPPPPLQRSSTVDPNESTIKTVLMINPPHHHHDPNDVKIESSIPPAASATAARPTHTITNPSPSPSPSFSSHIMTEEEACRILWPGQPFEEPKAAMVDNHHHLTSHTTNFNNTDKNNYTAAAAAAAPSKTNILNHNNNNNDMEGWARLVTTEYTSSSSITKAHCNGRGGDDAAAKYLVGNHVRLVEDKTLVAMGEKTLREQLDRRIGIGDTSY